MSTVADATPPSRAVSGVLATAALTAVALPLGALVPRVGAPIAALAIGMLVAVVVPTRRLAGLHAISTYSLQVAIVLLGATIALHDVVTVSVASLPVMLGSLATALLCAAVLGARLGVPERLRTLVGVGTGICGASAIAAVSGVIGARPAEIRYAISTIFVFNLVAVLAFPPLGHLLGLDDHAFGLWAGTAVNDTSSVVAAGFAYGHTAGTYAIVVKLTRTIMIIPVTLYLATRGTGTRTVPLRRALPWFLPLFLAASAASSLGALDASGRSVCSHAGLALTTVALAAVGLSTNLRELRQTGHRPLLLGALVWASVAGVSLVLQALTGSA